LRIDPRRVEATLDRHGISAYCLGGDDELIVAAPGDPDPARVRRLVATGSGLPPGAVRVLAVPELPRLPTGKPDDPALRELAGRVRDPRPAAAADLCALYAEILGVTEVTPDSSFVSLGGDSLSYVEMSLRLERAIGHLPADWHTRPIRDLRPRPAAAGRRALETSVALRAIAIVLVVGTHAGLFNISGGAHLLLGMAGFNLARFQLTAVPRRERVGHLWASIGRVAAPSLAWIAAVMLLLDDYGTINLVLLHSVLGPREGGSGWHFWFVEALVYLLVAVGVLLMVPAADRLERRFPYGVPMAAVALGLLTRYDVFDLLPRYHLPSAARVFWIFALGWAAAKASTRWRRLAVTGAILLTIPGYFDRPQREAVIMAGLVLLVWVPSLPSLAAVNRAAGVLAASSLYIYLTHWQVFPHLDHHNALLALAASLAAGIAYAAVAARAMPALRAPLTRRRPNRPRSPHPG
jgi:hypothetical protein